jgi:inactivated superfamily I helicase
MSQRFDEYVEEIDSDGWHKTAPVYEAIARERDVPYHVPVVVNGDITEYGHGNERSAMQAMFRKMAAGVGGPLLLPGLGNHDYENNVDDCSNNGCARDAVCDHIAWVRPCIRSTPSTTATRTTPLGLAVLLGHRGPCADHPAEQRTDL